MHARRLGVSDSGDGDDDLIPLQHAHVQVGTIGERNPADDSASMGARSRRSSTTLNRMSVFRKDPAH